MFRSVRGKYPLLLLIAIVAAGGWRVGHAASDALLLVYDPAQTYSALDAEGIRQALLEQQVPFQEFRRSGVSLLTTAALDHHHAVILADVALSSAEATALEQWVTAGGGLVVSGGAGTGLEAVLGLSSISAQSRVGANELRPVRAHPVTRGSYWLGSISQSPPMPLAELPSTVQLIYPGAAWPAYTATPSSAEVLARWRNSSEPWSRPDISPGLFANRYGSGRAVYSGALLGAYADPAWRYPQSWRGLIDAAVAWVNQRGRLIQLGYWPHAHRAAVALTADTERADMRTVVPAMLAMFSRHRLQRFGTFFIVGQAGGDVGTEGAVENPQIVAQILAAGAELAGHGDIHSRFAGQSLELQNERLQRMRSLIEPTMAGSGELLTGFRAPGLAADRTTLAALAAQNFLYDSSDQDVWAETTLPFFTGQLWQLPASAPMDWAILVSGGLSASEWELLVRDKLSYVSERRGLFNWLVHPWVIGSHLDRMESILRDLSQRDDLWLRRLDDILYWWVQRDALRLRVLESDQYQLKLELENQADRAVAGASVWLRQAAGPYPWRATVNASDVATVARTHGQGADADRFEVIVVEHIAARSVVLLEWRAQRPLSVFSDSFEGVRAAQH